MPEQAYWETLFDVERVLDAFEIGPSTGPIAELGCGYGTFTIPVARRTGTVVHAFDIDPEMIETTRRCAEAHDLPDIRTQLRDVFTDGFGLPDSSCGACLLFNILHGEHPMAMLQEAARIIRPGGLVAIIHWRSDIETPRGPSLEIRPTPNRILGWVRGVAGLTMEAEPTLLPPWHFGIELRRV